MYISRDMDKALLEWKNEWNRKPIYRFLLENHNMFIPGIRE